MIAFTVCILVCFLLGDLLHRFGASAEVSRKSVHITTCLAIAAYPLFGIGQQGLWWVGAVSFIAIALLRRTVLMRAIMAVERTSWGDLMLPLSLMITTSLGFSYPALLGAYLVLGISDALASLIGRAWGRRRYTLLGHTKSYVGSTAFFVSACVLLVAVGLFAGLAPTRAVMVAAAVAAGLTVIEACSHKGVDNLLVPLAAAGALHTLLSM